MLKKIIVSFLIIVGAFLFFAPQVLSHYLGNWALEKYVHSQGGSLTTKNLKLSWMGPQVIEGVNLQLKDHSVIHADNITLNASLLSALTNGIPFVNLNASNLSASFLNGTLQLQKTNFTAIPEDDNIRLNLNGQTTSDRQQGQFILEALVNPLSQKVLEASGTIDNLPVALIDHFTGITHTQSESIATAFLGSTANLTLQKREDIVLVAVDTSTLKGKFSISMPPDKLEFHNTSSLTFQASPALFRLLKDDLNPVALQHLESIDYYTFNEVRFESDLKLDHFTASITGDLEGFPVKAEASGALKSFSSFNADHGNSAFVEVQIPPEPFNKLRDAFYGKGSDAYLLLNGVTKVVFNLEKFSLGTQEFIAKIHAEPLVARNSHSGELIHFPQMNGQINRNGEGDFSLQLHAGNSDVIAEYKGTSGAPNLKIRATLNSFVYGIFSDLITGDPLIRERTEATLGNDLNGEATLAVDAGNGFLNLSLRGTNGSIDGTAVINRNILTLRTPFILQTKMSPPFAQTVLGPLLPFLSSAFESDQKVVLRIEPDGFIAPLYNPHLTNIRIGRGSLQLGRVQFVNDGAIESMLSILKPSTSEQIPVWFTPAYFSIQNSVLTLQRLDMLAMHAYHVAVWGNLDFNRERVDMNLGLAGTALNRAFNLPTPLTSDDMVAFPLRGKFGNASIDKTKAATQIAGLIAKLQGTPQGFIIGAFIQAAGKIGEAPVPPPTTRPFPWGGSASSAPETAPIIKKPVELIMHILGL